MSIQILLVDDEDLVRTGFRLILSAESDFEIVGEARNGADAVELTQRLQPDVVLMDIQMPAMNGLEATRKIIELADTTETRILILTTFDDEKYVFQALEAGAAGFLLKRSPAERLVEGIRVIARGDALLSPAITRRLISQYLPKQGKKTAVSPKPDQLTKRETEVLVLVAQGLSNQEIAEQLTLSVGTVKTHLKRIYAKLTLRDRAQAVIYAYNEGLVTPDKS